MKAAVMYQQGGMPQYADFPEPVVQNKQEVLVAMRTAAIKHIDKSQASGKHYSTRNDVGHAKVIGGDGVGVLMDGTRVFVIGDGTIAEKAVIDKDRMVKLPKEIDDVTAAALPNAVIGSAMALRFRAKMKRGETVLINGATGFTGRIAVQIAKHYGAKKIFVTGRNEESLKSLLMLGANEIISVQQNDKAFIEQIKNLHDMNPIDIVIDYLWGHTAELILEALKGDGLFTYPMRFVSVGTITGDKIQLSGEILRSVDLQLSGSGIGSWKRNEVQILLQKILPEMFRLAAKKKLQVDTITIHLEEIEKLYDMNLPDGKRVVVII